MELKKLLESSFDMDRFKQFISKTLELKIVNTHYKELDKDDDIEYIKIVENYFLEDNSKIEIIVIKTQSDILKAKIKYNEYLEKIAKNNNLNLALMAIFNENNLSVWKLSLVVFEMGNKLTIPNKYTFELGEDIAIKTAYSQLSLLTKVSTKSDYFNIFSVEKVYKRIF